MVGVILSLKQEGFAQQYLIDGNATQAAIRAGYSQKTAHSIGSRLLRNVKVADRISELTLAKAERSRVTADKVLEELARVAFFDSFEDGRVKMVDKLRALELIARHLQMFDAKAQEPQNVIIEVHSNIPGAPGSISHDGYHPEADELSVPEAEGNGHGH